MAIQFPAAIDAFTDPTSGSTLNSPPHHQQHGDLNDATAAVEARIGINGSVVATSVDYLLKNPLSVDPGHKHSIAAANGLQAALDALQQFNFCLMGA